MTESKNKLHLNQLYEQNKFLYFCNTDYHGNSRDKLGIEITVDFLEACEKDKFLLPLRKEVKVVKDQDGKDIEKEFKFYSPFQIYLVSAFMKNAIGENGLIIDLSVMDLEYQRKQNTRYINWGGGMSFNIGEWVDKDLGHPNMTNHFRLVRDFHNFLRFLHSCEVYDDTKFRDSTLRRMYSDETPMIQYNFKEIENLESEIAKFDLKLEDLILIYKNVGWLAMKIDPMMEWYYYIQKHDQLRRDEIRGLGGVAQELYNFCKIIRGVIEIIGDKELSPFIEYIQDGFLNHDEKQISRQADGLDILVVKKVAQEFLDWLKNNSEIIEEAIKLNNNIQFPYIQNLESLVLQLEQFYKKYGDIRYVGNMRTILPSKLKFEDLDMYVQREIKLVHRIGRTSPLSDEEMSYEITRGIEWRLDNLVRDVSGIAFKIRDLFFEKIDMLEREKPMLIAPLQQKYFDEIKGRENEEILQQRFWSDILYPEQKKIDDKIEEVRKFQGRTYYFTNEIRKVFCVKCRKKIVILHQSMFDQKNSNEAICDDCMRSGNLQNIKNGEWRCEYLKDGQVCDKLLYRFAHNNVISSELRNQASSTIELVYGQVKIEVKCFNCENISSDFVDWGWLP